MKKFLFLLLLVPTLSMAQFEGDWYTSFAIMGSAMRMQLDIEETPELKVILINPDMEGSVECDEANIEGTELTFKWSVRNLSFKGVLEEGVISGEMTQSGFSWDVTFTREMQEIIVVSRWQEPKAPFPYSSDSVQIENGDITLGATLVLPEGFNNSTPIVVLVSGSGPQNRNCEIAGHEPFWVIADHFARNGIASLRFDDRGTGTSAGSAAETTLTDFGSDAEACAVYLRKTKKFKKNPLGLAGHSEGGMHTLLAATSYKKIDFLIQLATVGTNGRDVLVTQQYDIPKAAGQSEELCKWSQSLYRGMVEIVMNNAQESAVTSLQELLGEAYDNAPESYDKSATTRVQFIMGNIAFINNQWMREFLAFETKDYLNKIDLPILTIHGGKDIQVAAESNSNGFADYENSSRHILPDLNHLLQPCEVCDINEYGVIDTTISPEVLKLMTDWILDLNQGL